MHLPALRHPLLVLASALTLTFSGLSAAEPPSRVARLGSIDGTVSFSPAGQPDWVRAVVNRPLTNGDRLWTDAGSRAELQLGGAAIRLGAATSVTLLNLDDRIAQLQLSQGTLKVRVRRLGPNQTLEVATPNLAFTLRRPGDYRIEVNPDDDATTVMVQSGEAEVYGEGASYAVKPRQGYRFYGIDLSDYELVATRRDDDLDRWAHERDRRGDQSASARYVSSEVVGTEDLDSHGTWRADRDYGNVWTPTRVAAGWTPYRDGHWAWIDPWGWTWIDDAPWGFAVSHYGRWANFNGAWGWVPGPPRERAVYAPALVAFVGGSNFQVAVTVGSTMPAAVGWFPLAPREVYRPSYAVSRGYFDNINRSNAVIAPATITNVYNTTIVNHTTTNIVKVVYANQQVKGAVIAVPAQVFVQSQPVAKAAMPLSREAAVGAPVARIAAVAPVAQSVHGGAPVAAARPPAREHAVVARTAPPPPPVPFAVQQKQLADTPGAPIDEAQRTALKPAAPAAATRKVSIVATQAAPTALPPPAPPAPRSPQARKADAARAHAADEPARGAKPEVAASASASAGASRPQSGSVDDAAAEAAKTAAAKAEATKAEATKAETAKAEMAKGEAVKAAATEDKDQAARADRARGDGAKAAAAKAEASKAEAAQAESAKADAAKVATAKAEATKAEAARSDATKAAATKARASKDEAARAETAKADATRSARATADAAKAGSAKADAAKVAMAKAEASKADAAKVATAKADASKAEAAKAESARAASAKAAAAAPPASSPRHDTPAQKSEPAANSEDDKKKPEDGSRKR